MVEVLIKYGFVQVDLTGCIPCGGPKSKWILPGTRWQITEFSRSKKFITRNNGHMLFAGPQNELDEYIKTRIIGI